MGINVFFNIDLLVHRISHLLPHSLSTTVSSGGLSQTTTNRYDGVGRLVWTRSPDGLETAYSYGFTAAGLPYASTIRGFGTALASTNTTVRHKDGQTAWTEFNGVRKTTYAYGVNADGSRWTKTFEGPLAENSPVWTLAVTENTYNAAGRLLATTQSSQVNPGNPVILSRTLNSYDALGEAVVTAPRHYLWGLDISGTGQGAGGVGGLLGFTLGTNWFIPLYDANGNVTGYVSANTGKPAKQFEYDAFGNITYQNGSPNIFRYRFSTKFFDHETGLCYYGYRFYDPVWGRWLNRDPIEEDGGLNLYAFCGNDAVNWWDLLGMEPEFGIMAGLVLAPSTRGGVEMSFNLIGSARWDACDWATFSADIGVSVLRGGMIGAPRGANGKSYNMFANVSGTVGYGDSDGLPFSFNGSQWVSALDDTYGSSASFGQTWYYNEALGESVRMANLRLQGGGIAFLNYNNDIWNPLRLGFGDGGDRGWTGGAMLGFAVGGGQTIALAFDDFTGKATNLKSFDPQNPNEQTASSRALNQAQWSILATGVDGMSLGFSFDSPDILNAQHWIHSTISKEAGYFSYPQSFDLRIKMQGSFGEKRR